MARGDVVPVAPIRDAVTRYLDQHPDESYGSLAERLGWMNRGYGDTIRLKRRLGLKATVGGRNSGAVSQCITYDACSEIARAIHVDPYEVGI